MQTAARIIAIKKKKKDISVGR